MFYEQSTKANNHKHTTEKSKHETEKLYMIENHVYVWVIVTVAGYKRGDVDN